MMVFGIKPDVSPIKLQLLKAMKIYDILNPNFQGIADDSCYLSSI